MEYAIPWFFYSLATNITVATSSVKRYRELDFFPSTCYRAEGDGGERKGEKENLISCAHRTKKRSLLRHRRDRKEGRKQTDREEEGKIRKRRSFSRILHPIEKNLDERGNGRFFGSATPRILMYLQYNSKWNGSGRKTMTDSWLPPLVDKIHRRRVSHPPEFRHTPRVPTHAKKRE